MSWKDVKIAKKLYIGFGAVLALTMAVGYVAYNGLDTVGQKVVIADDANRLIKLAKDCRQHEKNFILREDNKYLEELNNTVAQIYAQIDETKEKLEDQADKETIDAIGKQAQGYKTAVDNWVSLHEQVAEAIGAMVTSGRKAQAECEALRESQKHQIDEEFSQKVSHKKLQERVGKADGANRLIKYILECRRHEKNWQLRADKEQYANHVFGLIIPVLALSFVS